MGPKTKELLDLVKRSRGEKRVGIEHIRELVTDIEANPDAFLSEATAFLAPARRPSARPKRAVDPLALSLEGSQARAGLDRKAFLGFLVDRLVLEGKSLKKLAKKQQTLPAVIAFYKPLVGADQLEKVGDWVAREHSQGH
jgi:hypothetical protein